MAGRKRMKVNAGSAQAKTLGKGSSEDIVRKIRERAYVLFEKRGYTGGGHDQDWFEAERQIKEELSIKL